MKLTVEQHFEKIVRRSPFLMGKAVSSASQDGPVVALFHRSEVQCGRLVGRGGFSEVYEVRGFSLQREVSERLTQKQQDLRRKYTANVMDSRNGRCRYVIKQLQKSLLDCPKKFRRAATDLVVEGAYMSSLDHPNIQRLEGLPVHGLNAFKDGHDGFFLVMERLHETLDCRIERWAITSSNKRRNIRGNGKKRDNCDASFASKVAGALQIADALKYLHEKRIIFRDLKPANIGFSAADDTIKLFDLGLCRELPVSTTVDGIDEEKMQYRMSGAGTRRYTAVEVANHAPYNCKADVYAWSIVFWQILSLEKPFRDYDIKDHRKMVCEGGERPPIPANWPSTIRRLLEESWVTDVNKRLSMKEVASRLATILEEEEMSSKGHQQHVTVSTSNLSFLQSLCNGKILRALLPSTTSHCAQKQLVLSFRPAGTTC